jgi:hypothetical protein
MRASAWCPLVQAAIPQIPPRFGEAHPKQMLL